MPVTQSGPRWDPERSAVRTAFESTGSWSRAGAVGCGAYVLKLASIGTHVSADLLRDPRDGEKSTYPSTQMCSMRRNFTVPPEVTTAVGTPHFASRSAAELPSGRSPSQFCALSTGRSTVPYT